MKRALVHWSGFTLVEMLVCAVLLTLLTVALAGLTNGSLDTMNTTTAQLQAMAQTRALSDALESDLRLATSAPARNLNLSVHEDAKQVRLALNLPLMRLHSVDDYGPVANVLYVWDKKTRALVRAEYHALHDPDLVQSSGSDSQGADDTANEQRRLDLGPAGDPGAAFAWIDSAPVQAELTRNTTTPLLAAVADLEITCFKDVARQEAMGRNTWDDSTRLPAILRVRVRLAPQAARALDPRAPGVRPVELLVPVAQFDPEP